MHLADIKAITKANFYNHMSPAQSQKDSPAGNGVQTGIFMKETEMRVYYDQDADVGLIKSKNVVIVGYGSQVTLMPQT